MPLGVEKTRMVWLLDGENIWLIHTQLYSPSKAATIKNKQNKEKEAK